MKPLLFFALFFNIHSSKDQNYFLNAVNGALVIAEKVITDSQEIEFAQQIISIYTQFKSLDKIQSTEGEIILLLDITIFSAFLTKIKISEEIKTLITFTKNTIKTKKQLESGEKYEAILDIIIQNVPVKNQNETIIKNIQDMKEIILAISKIIIFLSKDISKEQLKQSFEEFNITVKTLLAIIICLPYITKKNEL